MINLPQSVERRQNIERNLRAFNLDYEIFPAIDGHNLSTEQSALVNTQEQIFLPMAGGRQLMIEDKLSEGEIGCALSHLQVYQKILESQDECACVLEDDCVVTDKFLEACEGIDKLPQDWDVVNFSYHLGLRNLPWAKKYYFGNVQSMHQKGRQQHFQLEKPYNPVQYFHCFGSCSHVQYFQRVGLYHPVLNAIFNRRRFLCMAVAYFIKRRACEKLIELGYPVRLPADYLLGLVAYNQLKIFRAFPMRDYYIQLQDFPSHLSVNRPRHRFVRV